MAVRQLVSEIEQSRTVLLSKLHLKNFKGVREFTLDLQGNSATIYGDNATGKTTLYDAFMWLFFDKDSLNRSSFGIKTLDENGEPLHGLDHIAEVELVINGEPITLKKVFYEKWVKQRGTAERVFSGHTTDYFINQVPVKKSEYDQYINDITDEAVFRLLTDPRYFNEVMHWQDRRNLLLEVCGDISDADVIGSDKKLSKLRDVLGKRSIDEHKKIVLSQQRKINKELERIPVRIDEVVQGMPDISELDFTAIESEIEELRDTQNKHRQAGVRIQSGGEVAAKQKDLAKIESDLLQIETNYGKEQREIVNDLMRTREDLERKHHVLGLDIEKRLAEGERIKTKIAEGEQLAESLREQWYVVNGEELSLEQDETCPTCGQDIPTYQLEQARSTALEAHNLRKAKQLEKITDNGKQVARSVDADKAQLTALRAAVAKLREVRQDLSF